MANAFYNTGKTELLDGTIEKDDLVIMFVGTGYTFDADHDLVDNGGGDSTDPSEQEITATNYTGGHEGSGRHALGTGTWSTDKANDRTELDFSNPSAWTALGGAANDTIGAALVIHPGASADTGARLVAHIDTITGITMPYTTNGSDFTLAIHAEGLFQF